MTVSRCFAHSDGDRPEHAWHSLEAHLLGTAGRAEAFAGAFASAPWGHLAGLWHDLGKYAPAFQERLRGTPGAVDHAAAGAALAASRHARAGLGVASAIAGHHAGLPNAVASEAGGPLPLKERLQTGRAVLQAVLALIPPAIRDASLPALPAFLSPMGQADARVARRRLVFWTRFLFSALVDADFLDTEQFFRPGLRQSATLAFDAIGGLRERLDRYLAGKFGAAPQTPVNRVRAEVLEACRRAADRSPGVLSLTVPTGGGKTLSAMAFALRHAERYGLRRVLAVIPYTSIIEQNAGVYREALGAENIIEHHSNIDPQEETERNRLASENWDAPVIVTTAVQFFESLFGNRPSRCRKLHNVARSVILLDEAQTLPTRFLGVILEALKELATHYGCTVVLSTATQPALVARDSLREGFQEVREIVPDPADLGRRLRRVQVTWPDPDAPAVTWPDLAAALARHHQVLAIVHRREDARELARLLPEEGRFHLSALMCAAHRTQVLDRVREALKADRVCRLVSTQVVEAGVDIDFPVVCRALGGLDSVVQAAGRCNREGRFRRGEVMVFRAPTRPPPGTLRKGLQVTEGLLRQGPGTLDPADPGVFEGYFRRLYFQEDLDAEGIRADLSEFNFATAARKFRLIEEGHSRPVVVLYGDAVARVEALRAALKEGGADLRRALRALQPYTVNVYPRDYEALESAAVLERVEDMVAALSPACRAYDPEFGLVVAGPLAPDPESLVV